MVLHRSTTNSSLQLELNDAMYNAYQLPQFFQEKSQLDERGTIQDIGPSSFSRLSLH